MKKGPLAAVLLVWTALAAGCVGYPHVFLAERQGQVPVAGGMLSSVKIAIVRDCQTQAESYETTGKNAQQKPDAAGRYKMTLTAAVWDWFNLIDGSYCQSRIQVYSCNPDCKPLKP